MSDVITTYTAIKNLEVSLLQDASLITVDIGTFDPNALTGRGDPSNSFSGPTSQWAQQPRGVWLPVDGTQPVFPLNAVNVTLRFSVKWITANSVFSMRVNERDYYSEMGANSIEIDVGTAVTINWSIQAYGKTFSDILIINRMGFGAFTIPAVPFGIIYAPPQLPVRGSYATYTAERWVGNSTKLEYSSGRSTSIINYADKGALQGAIGGLLSAIPIPEVQTFVRGLRALDESLGSASDNVTDTATRVTTEGTEMQVIYSLSETTRTQSAWNQGEADLILYLLNARVVWLTVNGEFTLSLLGYETAMSVTVWDLKRDFKELRDNPAQNVGDASQLDSESIKILLALDPFATYIKPHPIDGIMVNAPVGHAAVNIHHPIADNTLPFDASVPGQGIGSLRLDDPRFRGRFIEDPRAKIIIREHKEQTLNRKLTVINRQSNASLRTNMVTRDLGRNFSFFDYLFGGGGTSTSVSFFSTFSVTTETEVGASIEFAVTIPAQPRGTLYEIKVFQDVLFGTYAYQLG